MLTAKVIVDHVLLFPGSTLAVKVLLKHQFQLQNLRAFRALSFQYPNYPA